MFAMNTVMGLLWIYPYQTLIAICFGCILFRQLQKSRISNPNGLPLPPGPKGYPLIGNLLNMPRKKPWLVYDDWFKTYGDMIYFNVLGRHFLILGSLQRTTDLLEKRSSNYSDRMRMPMVELMNWDFVIGFKGHNIWWRKQRKLFHEHFHRNVVSKYQPIQKREVHAFLRRLLVTPDNFLQHIQHLFSATIMQATYGIEIQESDDPYISLIEEALKRLSEATIPGAFLIDFLPILKYVPSWFPGASFQKKAARSRELNKTIIDKPFRYVKEQLKNNNAVPSMAASLIERLPHEDDPQLPMEEKLVQDVTATVYTAGANTTASTVQALFLAMALYPEVQKKAQAEIDTVIGPNRLPDFEDRPSLPYINAMIKESARWHLVLPLAIPHMATNDDEYDGYYIPKGTIVFGNAWSISHDPDTFKNPMEFQPERHLKDGKLIVTDPNLNSVEFGFGRRICPGRHFSDNSLYILVSSLLAVYYIKPPVDDQGTTIKLKPEFSGGLTSYPLPFRCVIKPRTPAAEALIRDSVHEGIVPS